MKHGCSLNVKIGELEEQYEGELEEQLDEKVEEIEDEEEQQLHLEEIEEVEKIKEIKELKKWILTNEIRLGDLKSLHLDSSLDLCSQKTYHDDPTCESPYPCQDDLSFLSICHNDKLKSKKKTIEVNVTNSNRIVLREEPVEPHIWIGRDVYLDYTGKMFNEKYRTLHGGCIGKDLRAILPQGLEVEHYEEVINLSHIWGQNFYHRTAELVPAIFIARELILSKPHVPILLKANTSLSFINYILDLGDKNLTINYIQTGQYVHTDLAYTPRKPPCGGASSTLWTSIRELLEQKRLAYLQTIPNSRNLIVVIKRNHSRRLADFDELIEQLELRYPDQVAIFYGTEGTIGSRNLFARASVLIGAHGAGLTNMIFLPPTSSVIEILPNGYKNVCFMRLSGALGLKYQVVVGKGKKKGPLNVNLQHLISVIERTARVQGFKKMSKTIKSVIN